MTANRYVTLPAVARVIALAALLVIALTLWPVNQPRAEGRPTDGLPRNFVEMTAPAGFSVSASEEDTGTAFREGEAGFSAYHRIPESQADSGESDLPRLNIKGITKRLNTEPDPKQSNPPDPSVGIRGKGRTKQDGHGLNFGIVELPMVAAVGVSGPRQNVTVYYDDQGWIVAYLGPNEPAAAMWKHDQGLGQNLLLLAVNEVISAHNQAAKDSSEGWTELDPVPASTVNYYHWENPDCNAFVLFSATSNGGYSDPVKFVIPNTITNIVASAAALITRQQVGGAQTEARVEVDGADTATATPPKLLHAESFTLERDGSETSLHEMTVWVSGNESATGVVMLVYRKPAAASD